MYHAVEPGEEMPNPPQTWWDEYDEGGPVSHVYMLGAQPFGIVRTSGEGTVRSVIVSGAFTEDGKKMSIEPNEGLPDFRIDEAMASVEMLSRVLGVNH
jgi:hypothetical protein